MIANGLGRRDLIRGALAATACTPIIGPARADTRTRSLDSAKARDVAMIYRKLALSMGEEPGYWWLKGRRYALVDAELTPLWDMYVGMFFRTRDVPGGDQFDVASISISFYTDIDSGAFLTNAKNPFTGKTVAVGYFPPKTETARFNDAGRTDSGTSVNGVTRQGAIGPAWIEGDQVWVQGDYIARRDASADGPRIRINDLTTYFGSVSDVADASIKSAPAGQAFSDINTWPAWLEMGAQPGNYYSRILGHKVADYERMPARFKDLMLRHHPDIANNPAKWLDR